MKRFISYFLKHAKTRLVRSRQSSKETPKMSDESQQPKNTGYLKTRVERLHCHSVFCHDSL